MTVRKIGNSWWVDFRAEYKRYRKRSPENTRAGAQAYEAELRKRLTRGEQIDRASNIGVNNQTFATFVPTWIENYVIPNNKFSEAQSKIYTLNSSLIPFFGRMLISDIRTYHVEQYKARMVNSGLANKTIKNYLSILNKCLVCAYDWLELPSKPPTIKWPKCPPPKTVFLSPDQCDALLSHAEGTVGELVLMALRTGMRQGELKGLQWSSIDWVNRNIIIEHSLCDREKALSAPKSNKIRSVPLEDRDLFERLFRRRRSAGYVFTNENGRPLNHAWLSYHLTKLCEKAGLARITWHVLRHTFATQLAQEAQLHEVQQALGHSTITMTLRYAHVVGSSLREAVGRLSSKRECSGESFGQPVGNVPSAASTGAPNREVWSPEKR